MFAITASMSGCATYHITTDSLLRQFADTHPEMKVTNFMAPGGHVFLFFTAAVEGNNLRRITVLDKNNKDYVLKVTHTTSVRITQKSGNKTTFYFNTLLLKDSTITGNKTHFFKYQINPIAFGDIEKIELQWH